MSEPPRTQQRRRVLDFARAVMGGLWRGVMRLARGPLLAVAIALALGAILIAAVGGDPIAAYGALIDGAIGGRGGIHLSATLNRAAMIIGAALAASLALRAGFINIGVEGQMVLGGVTAALIAVHLPPSIPPTWAVLMAMTGAMVVGGLWALAAGLLKLRLAVPLLIGSLLLNYPASSIGSWLVSHPFRDRAAGLAASAQVPAAMRLPALGDSDLLYNLPIVLVIAGAMALYWRITAHGYEARMAGMGAAFARASGVDVDGIGVRLIAASGALAGLVAALCVLGQHYRYIDGMLTQPLYAWIGLMAVLLGRAAPGAIVVAGLFFAALYTGAAGMERGAGVPREIARVLLALVIVVVAARGGARLGRGGETNP